MATYTESLVPEEVPVEKVQPALEPGEAAG